jgi:predicted Zn-dependent protease
VNARLLQVDRREAKAVLILWAALLACAVTALLILNANATRLMNHIEYVKASRYTRTQALLAEAEKHSTALLKRYAVANQAGAQRKITLPNTDPDYLAAEDLYRRAFALSPADPYSTDMFRHYQRLGSVFEAVGEEQRQVRTLARSYLATGDYGNAESYASTLVTRDPHDAESWRLLAEIRLRSKQVPGAETAVLKCEAAGGEPAVVHELRARIALLRGDTATAKRELEACLKESPRNTGARKTLSETLANTGRKDEAARVLHEGIDLGGAEDGNYMDRYGNLLMQLGRNVEAADALETAAELEPNSAWIQWSLARAYLRVGKLARHNTALQKAFALDPKLRAQVMEK